MKRQPAPVPVIPLVTIIVGVLAAAGAALFMSVSSAHAEVEGPCGATIAGTDVGPLSSTDTGDAIEVDVDAEIVASMSSQQGFRSHKILLRFLGDVFPARTVEERVDQGEASFTENVKVSDYAWAGVGLYKVSGKATLVDGSTCQGAALVKVTGRNPLTTVAGGVAAGAAVLSTVGALASGAAGAAGNPGPLQGVRQTAEEAAAKQSYDPFEEWMRRKQEEEERRRMFPFLSAFGCLCLSVVALLWVPLMALTGGEPGGPAQLPQPPPAGGPPRRLPRAMWLPRITLLGIISGLLASAGGLVLLQQFAVVYPTVTLAVILLVIGAVVYGLVLPTLGYTIGWLRVNGKVARLERELGWRQ